MEIFPVPYSFRHDIEENNEYVNRTVTFESQKKQKQRVSISKLESWKITCEGTPEQRLLLKEFHERMGGDATPFLFYTPDNIQVIARFADGKLPIIPKRELDLTKPSLGTIVGYTCELVIEKVI